MALAACTTGGTPAGNGRHMQPLSERMLAELAVKDMEKESPILVRIFKEEAELEVWKQDKSGRFALLRTYPICRWSGQLGPKIKQGDRQAPEGFYTITPDLMNPNSNYYLAINTGFPNAYDRANGRTGALLMIHGDCSSSGCYAMTDEQIAEIYALARESFFGGQKWFQGRHVRLRGDLDELDVEHTHACLGYGGLGRAQHRRVAHERVAGRGVRDGDQAQADGSVTGARRDPNHFGRRQIQHRQVGEREGLGHWAYSGKRADRSSASPAASAAWQPAM